jgi:hypothetical protein
MGANSPFPQMHFRMSPLFPRLFIAMSDVIDLSKDDDVNNEPPAKRSRPSLIHIVIHDKEPQDSGSDYNYSAFLPSRQDTKIVGVYYSYADAVLSARDYVAAEYDVDDQNDGDDDSDSGPLSNVDWIGEGWFRQEDSDGNACDDRIHIQAHNVS